MSDEQDADSDEPPTLDDARRLWMFICFLLSIAGLVGFAVRFVAAPGFLPQSTPVDEGWVAVLMFLGLVVVYGYAVLIGIVQVREFWKSMTFADVLGISLGMLGLVVMLWNYLFGQVLHNPAFVVPRPIHSVVLIAGGCLLLYAKNRSRTA